VVPSPKSHAYSAIVPSASQDADASNVHAPSLQATVNDAIGGSGCVVCVQEGLRPRAKKRSPVPSAFTIPMKSPAHGSPGSQGGRVEYAIRAPSGDHSGDPRSTGQSGYTTATPVPSAFMIDSEASVWNRMRPSAANLGDQAFAEPSVSCATEAPSVASIAQMAARPVSAVHPKAMRAPSGDHVGADAQSASHVRPRASAT
jgi:hypothetical protein